MQVPSQKTRVSSDGDRHLDVHTCLAPGDLELALVVNNAPSATTPRRLSGLIGAANGGFATPVEADAFLSNERDSWGS